MKAPSAAPPNALRMWTDGIRIFVELPGSAGHSPYIVDFLYSEGGLSKALSLLSQRKVRYEYTGAIPSDYVQPKPRKGTDLEQAQAESILRQWGILK